MLNFKLIANCAIALRSDALTQAAPFFGRKKKVSYMPILVMLAEHLMQMRKLICQ